MKKLFALLLIACVGCDYIATTSDLFAPPAPPPPNTSYQPPLPPPELGIAAAYLDEHLPLNATVIRASGPFPVDDGMFVRTLVRYDREDGTEDYLSVDCIIAHQRVVDVGQTGEPNEWGRERDPKFHK